MLLAGKLAHVGAGFRHHHQRRRHVDAVDAREVHAAHLEQARAQVELGRVARLAALFALGWLAVIDVQALKLRIDFDIAFAQLLAAANRMRPAPA